jgi:hypothetical protein
LGDVLFSAATMDKITQNTGDLIVFGNHWERYALAFGGSVHNRLQLALTQTISVGCSASQGKIDHFYNVFTGQTIGPPPEEGDREHLVRITDSTTDIDKPDQYEFMKKHWRRRLDDRKKEAVNA